MKKQKTTYVDGFVLVVPKKNMAAYKKMATEASKIWKKFGALSYRECSIDDKKPPQVTFTFSHMIKAKPGEVVWFSYIEYKSKTHRNQVNKQVMAYMEKKYTGQKETSMPFDMKRMAYGGFKLEVDA